MNGNDCDARLSIPEPLSAATSLFERVHEAALLLTITTRRMNRLNSSRPQVLSTLLGEIATSLVGEARRQ